MSEVPLERKRKTFKVDEFRQHVNKHLNPVDSADLFARVDAFWEQRAAEGMTPGQIARFAEAGLLERVLFDTGNYHGFAYTDGARGDSDPTARHYF